MKNQCTHCGGSNLSWFCSTYIKSDVQQGRLRTNDVGVQFVQGCDDCSGTVHVVSGDKIAQRLNRELAAAHVA